MKISNFIDKTEDFEHLSQMEQVKLMSYFYVVVNETESFKGRDIRACFNNENLTIPANISRELSKLSSNKTKPRILVPKNEGYSFHRNAKKDLDKVFLGNKLVQKTNIDLRQLLKKIKSLEQKNFLEEAINCFEIDARRASMIMTWLLTMDTIFEYILNKKLNNFNQAIQAHGKYKKIIISKKDDFNEIKEVDFIELLRVAKIITNDQRKILDQKLGTRNTSAHPNSIKIGKASTIAYIEDLIENIITKFN